MLPTLQVNHWLIDACVGAVFVRTLRVVVDIVGLYAHGGIRRLVYSTDEGVRVFFLLKITWHGFEFFVFPLLAIVF